MYALVLIEYAIKTLDKTFTYIIPENLKKVLKIGMKVKVPFGNQVLNGFVLDINNNTIDEDINYKEIIDVVDPELVLNEEMLEIASFMANNILCTKISALQTMLPQSLKIKNHKSSYNSYDTYILLNISQEEAEELLKTNLGKNQRQIIEDLLKIDKVLKKNYSLSSIKTLVDKGYIREERIQKYRINVEQSHYQDKTLTKEQNEAYLKILESINENKTFLLYGITGSGKTEVYIKLIESVIKLGKTAILLVPEISLTAQITKRFYAKFGSSVAIFHSALSIGEKHDEYLKIFRNEVSVVIGTRSAIFAPLKNLGIIIIDEEHSGTYKQDNNPRYNAKDIALKRCELNNIPLVLGSATPTLESKARSDKGVFELVKLTKRVGNAILPEVHIVDMQEEMKKKNPIFSSLLQEKIKERIMRKEQIILLLNRRGYSTFINCANCGFIYKCPNCDISLTYHKTNNNLICHYCGYLIKKAQLCPKCRENSLNYLGLGTEKLEEKIKELFPDIKVLRMDQDTTSRKGSHEKIIEEFAEHKYDLLLGTQMISKGLDFPLVTLVGIINADTTLNIPDFRSSENTFSLLHQASGRAGRNSLPGEVIIQTFNPDNYVINCVARNDYDSFYLKEMQIRKILKYPPYYYLISMKVIGKNYENTLSEAKKVKNYLDENKLDETIVLGPTTASILKYNNEYRFQIMIKYRFDHNLKQVLKDIDTMYIYNKEVRLEIDFNPLKI